MADEHNPVPSPEEGIQLTDESARLAAVGRGEIDPAAAPPPPAPAAPPAGKPERPDYIPEKFWDAEKGEARLEALAKSYAELESGKGKPQQPQQGVRVGQQADGSPDPNATPEGEPAPAPVPAAEVFQAAQAEYATAGDLSAETREKIISSGIDEATLNTYLAGVKALEAQMENEVFTAAGGKDAYYAAVEFARTSWTPEQIAAFDQAIGDPNLRTVAVTGLMAAAAAAGKSTEGQLTETVGGVPPGDVYTDKEQFLKDLAAADLANDKPARQAAIAKLERSKKAKTLDYITPRSGFRPRG